MPWFALDDGFDTHPKVRKAGNAAVGLFVRLGVHATKHLTEGRLDGAIVRSYGTDATVRKLIAVGMLHESDHQCPRCPQPTEGDYVIHDYLDYNKSRAQIEAAREAARKRQNRGRESARRNRNERDSDAILNANSHENGAGFVPNSRENAPRFEQGTAGHDDMSRRDTHEGATVVPSPPLPSQLPMADVGGVGTGSGAPSDWPEGPPAPIDIDGFTVTDSMRRWANEVYPHFDSRHSTQQFIRHYRSTGTRRKNWPEAWRKWIAEDAERAGRRHLPAAAGAENVLHLPAARRPSITDQRVAEGMALADRLAAEEGTRP